MHKVAGLSIESAEYFFSIYSKPVRDIKAIDGIVLHRDTFFWLDLSGQFCQYDRLYVAYCISSQWIEKNRCFEGRHNSERDNLLEALEPSVERRMRQEFDYKCAIVQAQRRLEIATTS